MTQHNEISEILQQPQEKDVRKLNKELTQHCNEY